MEQNRNIQHHKSHIKDVLSPYKKEDFFDNHQYWLLYKKTEKLTTAVYLITDFLNDKECLKWKLRSSALSLLSFMISGDGKEFFGYDGAQKSFYIIIQELTSLLELATQIHLISSMNFSILREEYRQLEKMCEEQFFLEGETRQEFVFPERFFSEVSENDDDTHTRASTQEYKGHRRQTKSKGQELCGTEKDIYYKRLSRISGVPSFKKTQNKKENKFKRKELIVQFLRTKNEVNIKDISTAIQGCSEKTIQRELMSLIAQGVVERVGERRWSTYKIKHQKS